MTKTTAPALSFGARGSIAKTMVYSSWRGVKYARQHVIPANPRTVAQQANRTRFAFLRELWKLAPAGMQLPWDAFAKGRPFTGMNKLVGENNRVLQGETTLDELIFSPGAGGGLVPESISVIAGGSTGEVDIVVVPPVAPDGWTFRGAAAAALPDQDPTLLLSGPVVFGEDLSTPYEITLGGFTAGQQVAVGVWATWTKPNGVIAYSPSQTTVLAAAV